MPIKLAKIQTKCRRIKNEREINNLMCEIKSQNSPLSH